MFLKRAWCAVPACLLAAAWSLGQGQQPARTPAKPPLVEVTEQLRELKLDIREARSLAAKSTDLTTRRRMEQLLDSIEAKSLRLSDIAASLAIAPVSRQPLAFADMEKLVESIRKEPFDEGRLAVLKSAVQHAYFNCEQARKIVALFVFEDAQKKSALLLYDRLTDPVNFPSVVSVLKFESSRKEVLRAVSKDK